MFGVYFSSRVFIDSEIKNKIGATNFINFSLKRLTTVVIYL